MKELLAGRRAEISELSPVLLALMLGADSASLIRVTESLVKLYEQTGNASKAAEWRQKLPAED